MGQGSPEDAQQSFAWFHKAAEQGNANAQAEVGWAYRNGQGVEQDESQSVMWFLKSAEQGNSSAQYGLGMAYASGKGVSKDPQQAIVWYEKSAQQGHAKAQAALAEIKAKGPDVAKDMKSAPVPNRSVAEADGAKSQAATTKVQANGEAHADYNYEKIEVGTVLKIGIKLGTFSKPIPLPEGEWLVVNKRVEDIALRSSNFAIAPTPRVHLTLKNNQAADSLLYAMVMSFTPEPPNVNWGNGKCENTNSKALVDDFGYTPSSMLYLCATTWSLSGFKSRVIKAGDSKSKWDKDNLTALSAFPDDIADNTLQVSFYGNQYKGLEISFTFLIKREGDFLTDPAYAKYAKEWTHAAGLSLAEVLKRNVATFVLPTGYVAQAAQ